MSSVNPFDLLGDDDNDDPSQLIAAHQLKAAAKKPDPSPVAPAKLPTKPLPPAQAVREARGNGGQGRGGAGFGTGGRGGPGRGRGGRGGPPFNRDSEKENANGFSGGHGYGGFVEEGESGKPSERERGPYGGPRQSYRGGRHGGYVKEDASGETGRPRRIYERHSGTGRGNEVKREGSGRGNWGTTADEVIAQATDEMLNIEENVVSSEKPVKVENPASEADKDVKEGATNENEEKEQEDKEMTLEEYEKIREEKRKALLAMKAEERKVELDKELKSMEQLSKKKENEEIFVQLGSNKDSRRQRDNTDRDEKAKKSVTINEFLKPAEGERYYSPRGRGRGRGQGDRGPGRFGGNGGQSAPRSVADIKIEDQGQFPTLGRK